MWLMEGFGRWNMRVQVRILKENTLKYITIGDRKYTRGEEETLYIIW